MKLCRPTLLEIDEFAATSSAIENEFRPVAITDHRLAYEQSLEFKELTKENILEIHYILMNTIRPDIAGKIRNCSVWVGHRPCPPPHLVEAMLDGWLQMYGKPDCFDKSDDVILSIERAHVKFESIHPFEDGNGRTGRVILNWHRMMNGLKPLIIHPGEEQDSYYEWFLKHSI